MADTAPIEKPVLDIDGKSGGALDSSLPEKLPSFFDDEAVERVLTRSDFIRLDSMIKDVTVLLAIGDVDAAKTLYHKVMGKYNSLDTKMKKVYFDRVDQLYKDLSDYKSFSKRVQQLLKEKEKAAKAAGKR